MLNGLKKVSDCLGKVSEGLRTLSVCPEKVSDGLGKMSDGQEGVRWSLKGVRWSQEGDIWFLGICQLVLGRCQMVLWSYFYCLPIHRAFPAGFDIPNLAIEQTTLQHPKYRAFQDYFFY